MTVVLLSNLKHWTRSLIRSFIAVRCPQLGDTPLHLVAFDNMKYSTAMIETLVAAGADLNAKNKARRSMLPWIPFVLYFDPDDSY